MAQPNHHVTTDKNFTKPVVQTTPLPPEGAKRPMVGNDKAVAKKVAKDGGKSWNNGYTN